MRRPLIAALAVLALAAPALARDRNEVPDAVPTGPAQDCVPLFQLHQSIVRSDRVIDFDTGNGRRFYRNTLPNDCPGLYAARSFSYQTSLSQLCSSDIITVFETSPPMRGASCGLGQFQPVTIDRRHR